MSGFVVRNRRVQRDAVPKVPVRRKRTGVLCGTVVGINHVTGAAAAGTVVARLIVRAGKREQRIEQARLLQTQEHRIGPQLSPEPALAEFDLRLPRIFLRIGITDLGPPPASTLEHPQDVTRLRDLPALKRIEIRQYAFLLDFFRRRSWERHESLRLPIDAVTLAKMRSLERIRAVVVKRCAPQHGAMRHHAGLHFSHFGRMAARYTARLL